MDIEITETRSDHRSINIPKETCFQIDGILYATQNSFDQEEIFIVTITKRNYHRPPFQLAGRFSTKRKNTPRSSPPPLKIHVASRLICFFFSTPLKRARTYTSAVTCNTGRSIFRTFSFNGSRPFRCFLPAAVCKESYTHIHRRGGGGGGGFVFLKRGTDCREVSRKKERKEEVEEIGRRIAVTRCSININSSPRLLVIIFFNQETG